MEVKFDGINNKVYFSHLKLGDTYLDTEGVLCIKVAKEKNSEEHVAVLAFLDGEWRLDCEHPLTRVTKVKSILSVATTEL